MVKNRGKRKKAQTSFGPTRLGHYPKKGQSDIQRKNLGFGPIRSKKDEKEKVAERIILQEMKMLQIYNLEPKE